MALIPRRPFHLFEPFEELERFFDEEWPQFSLLPSRSFVPAVDIYEKDNNIIVETPLAGVDPEDVEITFENGFLVLKGETKRKTEVDEKDYYRKEVRYGSFYRKIALPAPVVEDKAQAVSSDGILQIVLPKATPAPKAKTVKIKVVKKK